MDLALKIPIERQKLAMRENLQKSPLLPGMADTDVQKELFEGNHFVRLLGSFATPVNGTLSEEEFLNGGYQTLDEQVGPDGKIHVKVEPEMNIGLAFVHGIVPDPVQSDLGDTIINISRQSKVGDEFLFPYDPNVLGDILDDVTLEGGTGYDSERNYHLIPGRMAEPIKVMPSRFIAIGSDTKSIDLIANTAKAGEWQEHIGLKYRIAMEPEGKRRIWLDSPDDSVVGITYDPGSNVVTVETASAGYDSNKLAMKEISIPVQAIGKNPDIDVEYIGNALVTPGKVSEHDMQGLIEVDMAAGLPQQQAVMKENYARNVMARHGDVFGTSYNRIRQNIEDAILLSSGPGINSPMDMYDRMRNDKGLAGLLEMGISFDSLPDNSELSQLDYSTD